MSIFHSLILLSLSVQCTLGLFLPKQILSRLGGYDITVYLSSAGKRLVTRNTITFDVNVQNLIDGQYYLNQSFTGITFLSGVFVTKDERNLVIIEGFKFTSYTQVLPGGVYVQNQTKTIPNASVGIASQSLENVITAGYFNGPTPVIHNFWFDGTSYVILQNLTDCQGPISALSMIPNGSYFVAAGFQQKVFVYQKSGTSYLLYKSFLISDYAREIYISQDSLRIIVTVGSTGVCQVYQFSATNYILVQTISIPTVNIQKMKATATLGNQLNQYLSLLSTTILYIFYKNLNTGLFQTYQNITFAVPSLYGVTSSENTTIIAVSGSSNTFIYYQCHIPFCSSCSNMISCVICNLGYVLGADGYCYPSVVPVVPVVQPQNPSTNQGNLSICVQNQYIQNFCLDFCDPSCMSCTNLTCTDCSVLYEKRSSGKCELKDSYLLIIGIIWFIISVVRSKNLKVMFLLIDDIWIYEYHKHYYVGVVSRIFATARYLQNKKNQIIASPTIPLFQMIQNGLRDLQQYVNIKFLYLQRRDDEISDNVIQFLFITAPLTILFFFICRCFFQLLFNYKISSYIRQYTFFAFIPLSLIEGNIQYFTFLAFRGFSYAFSARTTQKIELAFSLFFYFIVICYTFTSYFYFKRYYGKLIIYFLDNLYRIEGSTSLMIVFYCVRPFLRGITHSLLYEKNLEQLWSLAGIDIIIVLIMCCVQITKKIYKSKIIFLCVVMYLLTGTVFNLLLVLNLQYSEDQGLFPLIDSSTQVVLILRVIFLISAGIFNIMRIPKCLKQDKFFSKMVEYSKENQQNERDRVKFRNLKRKRDKELSNMVQKKQADVSQRLQFKPVSRFAKQQMEKRVKRSK